MQRIDLDKLLKGANERADRYALRVQRRLLRLKAAGMAPEPEPPARWKPLPRAKPVKKKPSPGLGSRWRNEMRYREELSEFTGLIPQLAARIQLRNIRRAGNSYEVVVTRARNKFSCCVAGLGEESLQEAIRLRDRLLSTAPKTRRNEIPRAVLRALGLSQPVIGVYRMASRSSYRVHYADGGRNRLREFHFRSRPEADAYAAAIAFRARIDLRNGLGEPDSRGSAGWDENLGPVSIIGARRGRKRSNRQSGSPQG